MMAAIPIVTDDADLAVELARLGDQLGVRLAPRYVESPWSEVSGAAGALVLAPPTPEALFDLARRGPGGIVVGVIGASGHDVVGLGEDLGIPVLRETRPFVTAVIMRALSSAVWSAQPRALPRAVRARLDSVGWTADRSAGRLVSLDAGLIGWQQDDGVPVALGEPTDVAAAGAAIRRSLAGGPPGRASLDGVDRDAVRDVLFGPGRALSDPASKSALAPYGLPLPTEELCASPSRAAAEAARIGFPVKLSLASPDLRVWDHPDLVVLGAANASAVREAFRTIATMAAERDPGARLLGVHVTAESVAAARLCLALRPIGDIWALAELSRSEDATQPTQLALPTSPERCRAALGRIGVTVPRGRASLDALVDAVNRLAVFVSDHRDAVGSVRVDPLAMLLGGGVEIREACVVVNDLFERSLGAAEEE